MIDTHCHLTFRHYEGRVEQVLADARAEGVRGVITIATTSVDAQAALKLAQQHENVWCSSGMHPLHSDDAIDWDVLREVGEDPNCVAWGELGLDNHYDKPPRALQDRVLEEQLTHLARWKTEGLDKPIVVHCREAFDDLIPVLRDSAFAPERFVFHCFTGSEDDARKVLDFGAWISFTGVVTFRNAPEVAAAAKLVPRDRIMVETDAPFLSPEPVRTARPNEPKYVVHIGRYIAELRDEDEAAFEAQLDANAERFFGITLPPVTNR
ncbi:MAG: TatD family deoxyribonuclease [Phycisphaerales bacterium]|nr:MAG: TatD family deoxyribonuclease [Phycisphaerales bacterium]